MSDPTIRIGLHETIAVVRKVLPVGTHVFNVHTAGNSILSSAYVKSGAGSVIVKWYDFHSSNGEEIAARFDLATHATLSLGQKDRLIVTKIHNNAKVEVIVSGAPAEVMLLATLVSDFPVELAGKLDGQTANLANDTGIAVSTYDPSNGNFYLLQSDNGALTTGSDVETPAVSNVTIAAANVEQSHTFPASTKRFFVKPRGAGRINLAHVATQSGTNYITIWPGAVYDSRDVKSKAYTIYFQSPIAGLVVEMEHWS